MTDFQRGAETMQREILATLEAAAERTKISLDGCDAGDKETLEGYLMAILAMVRTVCETEVTER
jgi:hypothetical protein